MILPLRRATTPYTFPSTSAIDFNQYNQLSEKYQIHTRGLDIAAIHREHQPWRPIEETFATGITDS